MSASVAFKMFCHFGLVMYFSNLPTFPIAKFFASSPPYLYSATFTNEYIFTFNSLTICEIKHFFFFFFWSGGIYVSFF